ncbi:hypothetical protein [Acinetobacter sp. YH16053]|uniref:hypothetical protein n=1 Tax=Acinetobacter sp. YH16053 TaxID=2601192 RepID=UPI0015D26E53|nr:hypothetical protein [Acinetobacter sp. YH16053]
MEAFLKGILMLSILLATSSSGLGLYTHDLLMLSVGILLTIFTMLFAIESKQMLNNPFRK